MTPSAGSRELARAKVNLYLRVVGRRDDGYHLLDSLAVFPGAADVLEAGPADELTLSIDGPFGGGLAGHADNLVLRAARALARAAGIAPQAALRLHKALPVASGIGGGSADAAAALRLLSALWRVPMLDAPGVLSLGADVPVCLRSAPMRMRGIGEVLDPAPSLPAFGIVLVNPGIAVSTQAVFGARGPGVSLPAKLPGGWADARSMARDLAAIGNDLEAAAIRLCPQIGEVLAWLRARPGCLLARMSGSGATCFGLFDTAARARAAVEVREDWWIWPSSDDDGEDGGSSQL